MCTHHLALPSGRGAGEQYRKSSRSGQLAPLAVTPASCGAWWRLVLNHRSDLPGYSGAAALSKGAQIDEGRVS